MHPVPFVTPLGLKHIAGHASVSRQAGVRAGIAIITGCYACPPGLDGAGWIILFWLGKWTLVMCSLRVLVTHLSGPVMVLCGVRGHYLIGWV
jgi:hypothetical protein